MRREHCGLYLLALISTCVPVLIEPNERPKLDQMEETTSFGQALGTCLAQKEYGTIECVNRGGLSLLRSLNEKDDLDFGEVHLQRADSRSRELLDWDYDPKDFGNVLKAATKLMEHRSMKWSLDNLYPGLQMLAGPTLNGNGVLEFALDERVAAYNDRQEGTGRQLTRHLLLPLLLGFKFNLASLIPLLFGFLLLVTKKALLLTKIALFVSGLLGWNSLFSLASTPQPGTFNGFHGFNVPGHEVPVADFPYYDQHQFVHRPYRGLQTVNFPTYDQHIIREVVNVYENGENAEHIKRMGKNVVWSKNNRNVP
ncbi:hypothetical protein KM043_006780 [Ampulex compressa]|nr:hypothetical protein KM043_006780 [Ampulex compressa]